MVRRAAANSASDDGFGPKPEITASQHWHPLHPREQTFNPLTPDKIGTRSSAALVCTDCFDTAEEATAYCERQGIAYQVFNPKPAAPMLLASQVDCSGNFGCLNCRRVVVPHFGHS